MKILSVERFMDLIRGFETLKNFLFHEKMKVNIDMISSINDITDCYDLNELIEKSLKNGNVKNENEEIMKNIIEMMKIHN